MRERTGFKEWAQLLIMKGITTDIQSTNSKVNIPENIRNKEGKEMYKSQCSVNMNIIQVYVFK